MIFSCDDEEREEAIRRQKLIDESVGRKKQFYDPTTIDAYGFKDREIQNQEWMEAEERIRKEKEQKRIDKCKKRLESKIKKIDDRMSQGYTASLGETLKDRRRSLVKKLATDCQ